MLQGERSKGPPDLPVLLLGVWDQVFLLGSLVPAGLGPWQHCSHVQAGLRQARATRQVSRRVWRRFCTILTPLPRLHVGLGGLEGPCGNHRTGGDTQPGIPVGCHRLQPALGSFQHKPCLPEGSLQLENASSAWVSDVWQPEGGGEGRDTPGGLRGPRWNRATWGQLGGLRSRCSSRRELVWGGCARQRGRSARPHRQGAGGKRSVAAGMAGAGGSAMGHVPADTSGLVPPQGRPPGWCWCSTSPTKGPTSR